VLLREIDNIWKVVKATSCIIFLPLVQNNHWFYHYTIYIRLCWMNGLFFGVCISWYNVPLLLSGFRVFIALQMITFLHLVVAMFLLSTNLWCLGVDYATANINFCMYTLWFNSTPIDLYLPKFRWPHLHYTITVELSFVAVWPLTCHLTILSLQWIASQSRRGIILESWDCDYAPIL